MYCKKLLDELLPIINSKKYIFKKIYHKKMFDIITLRIIVLVIFK